MTYEEYLQYELEHSGTLGMHWHVRRWQNEDGSLTPAGRDHYGVGPPRGKGGHHLAKQYKKSLNRMEKGLATLESERERARIRQYQAAKKGKENKYNKRTDELDEINRRYKALNKILSDTAREASNSGFNLSYKNVTRHVQKGRLAAQMALTGPLAGVLTVADEVKYGKVGRGAVHSRKWDVVKNFEVQDAPEEANSNDSINRKLQLSKFSNPDGSLTASGKRLANAGKAKDVKESSEAPKQLSKEESDARSKYFKDNSDLIQKIYDNDKKYKMLINANEKLENAYKDLVSGNYADDDNFRSKLSSIKAQQAAAQQAASNYLYRAIAKQKYQHSKEEFGKYLNGVSSGSAKRDDSRLAELEKQYLEAEEEYKKIRKG